MKAIVAFVVIVLLSLFSCRKNGSSGRSEDGGDSGGSTPDTDSFALVSVVVRVPSEPILPGIRNIAKLNRIVTDRNGQTVSIRLAFDSKSSDTAIWEVPEVRQGWIRIHSDDGVIRVHPERMVEIAKNGKIWHLVGSRRWIISFSPNHFRSVDGIGIPGLSFGNVQPYEETIFRLPLHSVRNVNYVSVSIEFSSDYECDAGNWYVFKPV